MTKMAIFSSPPWRWECETNHCVKRLLKPEDRSSALSLSACEMFCGDAGVLWPKPTGKISLGNHLVKIDLNKVTLETSFKDQKLNELLQKSIERFKDQLSAKIHSKERLNHGGQKLIITPIISVGEFHPISLDTDESYELFINQIGNDSINATIVSKTYFGARNGIETLNQLVIYDDIRMELQIVGNVLIEDAPVYRYRGILLDTSRNYYSVKSIKRTIDAMATSKLNTFHWHITDSHSFPFETPSLPELYQLGAYKPHLIYSTKDIEEILEYALFRGVRVLPEFDAPAHVGEGFQNLDVTACFNAQPWNKYCVEPPCGQLDPTKEKLYDILLKIYKDMFAVFQPDIFHMGGDEVSNACWNYSTNIQNWMVEAGWGLTDEYFLKLWGLFQEKALAKVEEAANRSLPIIMWTSHLTELPHVTKYLNKDKYIIQVWTTGSDRQIKDLLSNGYKLIMSNYDALYFDCGFGAWVGEGNNWCSPYIGWQKVYANSPKLIAGSYNDQILGGEAALWSEQADEHSLDARLWPRAAALSERLWSEPDSSWEEAETRFLEHRERLIEQGIAAESIKPQWCLQNEGNCHA